MKALVRNLIRRLSWERPYCVFGCVCACFFYFYYKILENNECYSLLSITQAENKSDSLISITII